MIVVYSSKWLFCFVSMLTEVTSHNIHLRNPAIFRIPAALCVHKHRNVVVYLQLLSIRARINMLTCFVSAYYCLTTHLFPCSYMRLWRPTVTTQWSNSCRRLYNLRVLQWRVVLSYSELLCTTVCLVRRTRASSRKLLPILPATSSDRPTQCASMWNRRYFYGSGKSMPSVQLLRRANFLLWRELFSIVLRKTSTITGYLLSYLWRRSRKGPNHNCCHHNRNRGANCCRILYWYSH